MLQTERLHPSPSAYMGTWGAVQTGGLWAGVGLQGGALMNAIRALVEETPGGYFTPSAR